MREIIKGLSERDLEILNIIQKKGPITKKELQNIRDIKLTTLNRTMKILEDNNLISEVGISESTGGRKPSQYDVCNTKTYIIGIDISRTHIKLLITNLKMTILDENEFEMDYSISPQKAVDKIGELIENMLEVLLIDKKNILGIGIGTVGPLDREKGIILNPEGFQNGEWFNVHIKEMIEKKTSLPCFIDNGANTAVLAEYLYGIGKNLKNIVYVNCGMGIRSAVIADGIIIRSINDSEDAFAHMIVNFNGEKCACGNRGCIESYASIDAIIKKYIFDKKEHNNEYLNNKIEENKYREIFELIITNDKYAEEYINKGGEILGIGLSNLTRILNPELVILCGPLVNDCNHYYDMCINTFHNKCIDNKVIFSKGGQFKENVIAIGSAAMVLEFYINNVLQ